MTPNPLVIWLGWACYAGAGFAIIIYVKHLLGPQGWKRPWSAAGLLFTSLALGQTPFLFEDAYDWSRIGRAILVTLCLLVAVGLQTVTLLRSRPERDAPPAQPPPAEPPREPAG